MIAPFVQLNYMSKVRQIIIDLYEEWSLAACCPSLLNVRFLRKVMLKNKTKIIQILTEDLLVLTNSQTNVGSRGKGNRCEHIGN